MEEEKQSVETRYFHVENIGKNLWTSLIGGFLMALGVYAVIRDWFFDDPTSAEPYQIVLVFVAGFALLFMKDKLPSFIEGYFKKKTGV